jgi:hypothetical protein
MNGYQNQPIGVTAQMAPNGQSVIGGGNDYGNSYFASTLASNQTWQQQQPQNNNNQNGSSMMMMPNMNQPQPQLGSFAPMQVPNSDQRDLNRMGLSELMTQLANAAAQCKDARNTVQQRDVHRARGALAYEQLARLKHALEDQADNPASYMGRDQTIGNRGVPELIERQKQIMSNYSRDGTLESEIKSYQELFMIREPVQAHFNRQNVAQMQQPQQYGNWVDNSTLQQSNPLSIDRIAPNGMTQPGNWSSSASMLGNTAAPQQNSFNTIPTQSIAPQFQNQNNFGRAPTQQQPFQSALGPQPSLPQQPLGQSMSMAPQRPGGLYMDTSSAFQNQQRPPAPGAWASTGSGWGYSGQQTGGY